MIPVRFDLASLPAPDQQFWRDWLVKSNDHTNDAIDAFETWLAGDRALPLDVGFKTDVWKELKDWFRDNTFYRRCAYCERLISGFTGDAEHYRPKGSLQISQPGGKPIRVTATFAHPDTNQTITIPHPGYFWLAYDWRNLVPACKFCNSGRGKNALFDTANDHLLFITLTQAQFDALPPEERPRPSRRWPGQGIYYPSPAYLDRVETPLFLNPLNPAPGRDPHDHIRFKEFGIAFVVNASPIGERTMKVFSLTNGQLIRDRQEAQERFQQDFLVRMLTYRAGAAVNPGKLLIDEYRAGKYPFSGAALDYYDIFRAQM